MIARLLDNQINARSFAQGVLGLLIVNAQGTTLRTTMDVSAAA